MNSLTGEVEFQYSAINNAPIRSTPCIDNCLFLVTGNSGQYNNPNPRTPGSVYILDNKNGNIKSRLQTEANIFSSPVQNVKSIYFGSDNGRIYVNSKYNLGPKQFYKVVIFLIEDTETGNKSEIPEKFQLFDNYPNPFNPETTIGYVIDKPSWLNLTIYNSLGQKVKTLNYGWHTSGNYHDRWDGTGEQGIECDSGLYFYKLNADKKMTVRKMLLLR